MKKRKVILLLATLLILSLSGISLCTAQKDAESKIALIDKKAQHIDSLLILCERVHRKCTDCFGNDKYYLDSVTLIKNHNYQSCFNIDYYYENRRLILVTIDGSFYRDCGWTEAPYCWDSTLVRDYKARIYYDRKKVLKITETGTKPCCEILPCGNNTGPIDFNNKATILLEKYGRAEKKIKSDFVGYWKE